MHRSTTPPVNSPPHSLVLVAVLVAAVMLAYWNSLAAPFLFDDISAVSTNPTIRQFGTALTPPADGRATTGRPVLNFSFAVNYALSGNAVWSYHALNILIHAAAALALFGIVRRTLALSGVEGLLRVHWRSLLARVAAAGLAGDPSSAVGRGLRTPPQNSASAAYGDAALQSNATLLAFAIALLWTLHPLQTESVTGISQRSESLCGLFYLLTLYGFIRGVEVGRSGGRNLLAGDAQPAPSGVACQQAPPSANRESTQAWCWLSLSILACLLGMGTKEVMVTAPLLVLLYDRTFLAGSFAAAWRQRRGYYGALAATWLLLAWLVLAAGGTRGDAAGLGLGVSGWEYLLKQSEALVLYLKLSFWPHPLVVDYGAAVVRSWTEVWWQGPAVLALLAGTAWGLWRRPALGFLGAWFFVILAPSSSVVPLVSQAMAEHRMYLPLASVIVAVVLGSYLWAGRRSLVVLLVLAVGAGWLTVRRNEVYRSELSLWSDAVAQRPANSRARTNLGIALFEAGRIPEAVAQYEESLRLEPADGRTHLNLCLALIRLGRTQEAVPHGEEALRLNPGSADAHVNLAAALAQLGRTEAAITHYEEARRLQPDAVDVPVSLAAAYYDLGNRAAAGGNLLAAITRYRQALELAPDHLPAHNNLANALLVTGRIDEAIAEYRQILRQRPDDRSVQENLARALELQRANRAPP